MTTFISYSRVNSDFAVRLAQDLKSAGFDVWLDQIDIPTGARWDDEIEKALEISTTFLIVLSPESIQSQNVKDEIGYAIDAGKHILPVVLQNCRVPFRLRRFQYVDFTGKPYEGSLVKIKYLLSNTRELVTAREDVLQLEKEKDPSQSHDVAIQNEPIQETKPVPVGVVQPNVATPPQRWNPIVFISGAVVLLVVVIALLRGKFIPAEPHPTAEATLTPLSQISVPVQFTETSTSIPPSETPTLAPSTATPLPEEIKDVNGVGMRLVPAGEFMMGSDSGEPDEKPTHTVFLDAYYIDKYEVTNALYSACVAANVCDPPKHSNSFKRANYYGNPEFDNYPVIFVDWGMAKTYCEWRGGQLPTEAQWEKAVRGTDGWSYPWGEGLECSKANYGGCVRDTNFVGSAESGKSSYGIYDLAGNVWEWVADWYSAGYYQNSPVANPQGPDAGTARVLRGGSWADLGTSSRSSNRYSADPLMYGNSVGFRCALTP